MFLSLDLGSTSFKAAIYDRELNLLGGGSTYLDYAQLNERVELSLDTVSAATKEAVQKALKSAQLYSKEITAVALTSQAQTFALRMGNKFVTSMISWQDSRATSVAAAMETDPLFASFGEHASFHAPTPGLMLCLLSKVLEEHPGFRATDVIPLPSYIMEKVTGQLVLDENLAAMSGLWSLPERKWNEDYLRRIGITAAQLPAVAPLPAPAGTAQPGNFLGLPIGCPVYSAGNDQTAGAYAAELEHDGGILITLGSAQVVYQWTPELSPPEKGIIRGVYPMAGSYRMVADCYGGNLILRAVKQLELAGFDAFFQQAEAGFSSEAALPTANPGADWVSWLDESASVACKCAAILEFLGGRMAKMIQRLETGESRPLYLTDGGGGRQAAWRNCTERKLGRTPTLRAAAPDRGAARMMRAVLHRAGQVDLQSIPQD